jgi:MFS family permease
MNTDKKGKAAGGLGTIFRSLSHRNYRLFFGGQGLSLVGTWMQQIAVSWLVYRLTHSVFMLGVVGFASRIPTFLLAPAAGVLVDRWNRHRTLVITQVLSMVQALVLAILVLTGTVQVWQIICLTLILGIINSFDVPVRQSFVVDMIGRRQDLGNAIALNSSMVNGARLVGPSLAGILIAAVGEGICFLVNALSFLAVIVSLIAMTNIPKRPKALHVRFLRGLKEGFAYAFGFTPIRYLLLLLALVSLMGMGYMVLMPVFAKEILHGGAHTYGFLMGATGVGALTGALFLASRKTVLGLSKIIAIASGIFGAGLVGLSVTRFFIPSLLLMATIGFGMMVQMAATNTVIQTLVDDDKRGRVMSLYAMAFMGMTPFGSLLAGGLAHSIGVPYTVAIGGVTCLAGSLLFARKRPEIRKMIRPIYREKGIIASELTE